MLLNIKNSSFKQKHEINCNKNKIFKFLKNKQKVNNQNPQLSSINSNGELFKLPLKKAEKFWNSLGPGFTTGAADDDPSGIATYSQAGAKFGLNFLWVAPFTFPLMAIVQEMCAKIGLVTGRGLSGNIKKLYPKKFLYTITLLLLFANIFNIGANLGAMANVSQLIFPQFSIEYFLITFVVISLIFQIFFSYKNYSKYLKWLALILFAYILASFFTNLNASEILKNSIIPKFSFSKESILMFCALLGTTISPYLFFWQTSQEVEEEILNGKTTLKLRQTITSKKEISSMRKDVWFGMFFSNLIAFFIIITASATLHLEGISNINTASQAAMALRPIAGEYAFLLFSLGIVGTGLLSIPVLAGGASYALSETFGWKQGLYKKIKQAKAFYGTIIIAMLLGMFTNFLHINPINLLIYSAIINGLISPLILIPILQISGNKEIMGNFKNSRLENFLGWFVVFIMILVGVMTLGSLLF